MLLSRLSAAAFAVGLLVAPGLANAGEALVAVAANFTAPVQEIGKAFTAKTGDTVKFSFGSTGALYTQISQGAPFDAFLAFLKSSPEAAAVIEKYGYGMRK